MAAWTKPPLGLIDLFDEHLPDDPHIERRKMFGLPCAFVNGNLFAGLFQDQIFARLPQETRVALEARHGPLPFAPMGGRASKTYMSLPDDMLADEEGIGPLLAEALAYTAAMPPKVKAPRRAPKAR